VAVGTPFLILTINCPNASPVEEFKSIYTPGAQKLREAANKVDVFALPEPDERVMSQVGRATTATKPVRMSLGNLYPAQKLMRIALIYGGRCHAVGV
jgi:hypothetical protein